MRLSDPFNLAKYVRYKEDKFVDFRNSGIQKFKQAESFHSNIGLKVSKEIQNANGEFLTELSYDYLNFLQNSLTAERIDFNNMIRISGDYRKKFLNA